MILLIQVGITDVLLKCLFNGHIQFLKFSELYICDMCMFLCVCYTSVENKTEKP